MKTILVLSASSVVAHVVRVLEVAKALRSRGGSQTRPYCRVVFAGEGQPLRLVAEQGFEVLPLPDLEVGWAMARLPQGPQVIYTLEIVESWVQAELALLRELHPDAVLQDGRLSASTSTAVAGIPLISLGNAYLSPYAVDGLLGRGGSQTRPYPGPPPLVGPGAEIALNVVRERYGLSAVVSSLELLIGDLNLMCDVPEYAPVQNTPDNFRYVGPIIWNGVPQRPAWLDALDPDRPTIYFTMGSTGRPEAFRVALEAFGSTEYRVMMTVGGLLQPETLQPIPPNFYLAAFGPGDVLARRADVVICHGGNGTTYQALAEGVPLVVWPFVRDQQWNARRQAELGVGLTLRELTPGAMRGAVATVLAEPSYRAAAERFRQIIASYDGPRTAAQLIHGFIGQRPSIGR